MQVPGGSGAEFASTDPGTPERVVAVSTRATPEDADGAVRAAADAFPAWRDLGAERRAAILTGAAAILRERRLELAALQVRECAKPWPEADADVCEAIDFLEYYARAGGGPGRGARAAPGAGRAQHDALGAARRRSR